MGDLSQPLIHLLILQKANTAAQRRSQRHVACRPLEKEAKTTEQAEIKDFKKKDKFQGHKKVTACLDFSHTNYN